MKKTSATEYNHYGGDRRHQRHSRQDAQRESHLEEAPDHRLARPESEHDEDDDVDAGARGHGGQEPAIWHAQGPSSQGHDHRDARQRAAQQDGTSAMVAKLALGVLQPLFLEPYVTSVAVEKWAAALQPDPVLG